MSSKPKSEASEEQRPPLFDLGPTSVLAASRLIESGKTYDLDCGRWTHMPQWPGHAPFQVLAYRTPRGVRAEKDWDWLGTNSVEFGIHSELLMGSAHTGTHIDALCHATCGADDHWYGGDNAAEHLGDFGPQTHDAAAIPPIFARGVLLDIAALKGVDALPASTPIGVKDLEEALDRQDVALKPGDAVLVRTGYLSAWPDTEKLAKLADAGVTLEGAEFLMDAGAVVLGSDTESYEVLPSPDPESPHPVHLEALIERGVYIMEMIYLEEMARDGVSEFAFVCLPLKLAGATGSWVRPIAVT